MEREGCEEEGCGDVYVDLRKFCPSFKDQSTIPPRD